MSVTPTTPGAIRDALVTYIAGMTPTTRPDLRWRYRRDEEIDSANPRAYSMSCLPSSQEFEGPYGGGGVSAAFDLEIRVGMLGLPREDAEEIASDDRRDLEKLIHPLPQHGAQGIAGLLPLLEPVTYELDESVAIFTIPIRYWEAS